MPGKFPDYRGGFTLLEVILASAILLTVLAAALTAFTSISRTGSQARDHALALDGAGVVVSRAAAQLAGAATIRVVYLPNATHPQEIQVTPLAAGQTQGPAALDCTYTAAGWPNVQSLSIGGTAPSLDGTVTQFSVTPLDQTNTNTTVYTEVLQLTATVAVNGQAATASQVVKTLTREVSHPVISASVAHAGPGDLRKETTVILVSGDGIIRFDVATLSNTVVSLNGRRVPPSLISLQTVGGQPTGLLQISGLDQLNLLSRSNLLTVEQTGVPVPADPDATTTAVAATSFSYSPGGEAGSAWQPPNGPSNYVSYLLDQSQPPSSQGYLGIGDNSLVYLPLAGGLPYADIYLDQTQGTGFSYRADVILGRFAETGRTAGLVFCAPAVAGPVQGGFLYFGVRLYGDGHVYAVFSDRRQWPDPSAAAGYVQLARVGRNGAYRLMVQGSLNQFTFFVNGRPVGQESVSGLTDGDVYTGVWQYPAALPGVIYSNISLDNSSGQGGS